MTQGRGMLPAGLGIFWVLGGLGGGGCGGALIEAEDREFVEGKLGRGITFEMQANKITNKKDNYF